MEDEEQGWISISEVRCEASRSAVIRKKEKRRAEQSFRPSLHPLAFNDEIESSVLSEQTGKGSRQTPNLRKVHGSASVEREVEQSPEIGSDVHEC